MRTQHGEVRESKGKEKLDLDNAKRNAVYARKSTNVTLVNPEILATLVLSEDLPRTFGDGPVNTDVRPSLEYVAPRLFDTVDANDTEIPTNIQKRAWLSPAVVQTAIRVRTEIDTQIDLAAYAFSLQWPFPNMVNLPHATPAQRERFLVLAENYAANHILTFSILGDKEIERKFHVHFISHFCDLMPCPAGRGYSS
jgi:hypothetical protein